MNLSRADRPITSNPAETFFVWTMMHGNWVQAVRSKSLSKSNVEVEDEIEMLISGRASPKLGVLQEAVLY